MANLAYRSQFNYSFCGQPVTLLAQVNIGATGAPTLVSGTGMGVASVTRVSAGKYTIALSNAFASLLEISVAINSGASAPAAPSMNIVTNSVSSGTAPLIQIQMRDVAGAATDPASGEILLVRIALDRSSLGH